MYINALLAKLEDYSNRVRVHGPYGVTRVFVYPLHVLPRIPLTFKVHNCIWGSGSGCCLMQATGRMVGLAPKREPSKAL